ncbi:MAG: hypothetical protein F4245_05500 [Cenarchaeum sp. SB0678_bin_8]|nr:hypothetical protein [Cenarchaeum sp. SB0666_bin_15]MYD59052.1 hypothetical protein [Cenarchaeum sp. SB0678_bin_8]
MTKIHTVHMDAEDHIVTNVLDSIDYPDEHKRDIRAIYDRVYKLFVNASANRNLDNFFLTKDAVNYSNAFGIMNTAPIHAANADYQTSNMWADIYNKAVRNAGLTDKEKSFLYCLSYMLRVESLYSPIVDKICYLLAWQTKPPGIILGENKHCCRHVDTIYTISTRCTLATKIEFLAGKGFGDLTGAYDRDLRNAVAHMTAVIGKPTVKSEHYNTETITSVENKFSVEGTDIHVRRCAGGADKWEKVDVKKAIHRLEMTVRLYITVFKLCDTVHKLTTDQMFMYALNNPNDPHYTITFSNGDVRFDWSIPDEVNG